jgi:hypothetical protein
MRSKICKTILALFVFVTILSSGTVCAETYLVPLNVNGSYYFLQSANFSIDLGVEFSQINEVRFQAQGDITAVDAPGYFSCRFITEPDKMLYSRTTEILPSSPPISVPFDFDSTFTAFNGATWNFLLDGKADGYVMLTSSVMYADDPPQISGNINSAYLFIDATPTPEPATFMLIAAGIAGTRMLRNKTK